MRSDIQRLEDIIDAISLIEDFTSGGRDLFYSDKLIQSAVIYQIQILGEAAYNVSKQLKTRHHEVPWIKIEGTRHIIVHDYFRVDPDIIWSVIHDHLPLFKSQIEKILNKINKP